MTGAPHRHARPPAMSTVKGSRLLAMVLIGGVAPLALIALDIYWLVIGADMDVIGLSSLIALASVGRSIVRRRDAFSCWTGAALVLLITAQLARIYGHHAGWPGAHAMSLLREVTLVAGIACFAVTTVIGGRACIRWWRQRRPAQPDFGLPAR